MRQLVTVLVCLFTVTAWVIAVALVATIVAGFWKADSARGINAIQEASLAAMASLHVIAVYAVARAVDAVGRKVMDVVEVWEK